MAHQTNQAPANKVPLFFREDYSGFIARGNFMTLALQPQMVESGEWLAHQSAPFAPRRHEPTLTSITPVSEQYRLLAGMIKIIQEVDPTKGRALCNDQTCPTMSAGKYVSWRNS